MGKQGDRKAENSVLRNGSSTVVRRAPTANNVTRPGGDAPPAQILRGPCETDWDALQAAYHVTLNG